MNEHIGFNPEFLRPVEHIGEPDPRQHHFVVTDQSGLRPITINDYHRSLLQIKLNIKVPEDIVTQFETAKNLYLYAWFIYRFYPVAEHHAFVCLEFALHSKYEKEIPKSDFPKKLTLKPLLQYAINKGHIKNEGFHKWHKVVERRARIRYETERLDEMREKGLKQIELNYAEAQITDIDRNFDYVKILLKTLPCIRNVYAHGTSMLHKNVLNTLEIVAEIINQLYPKD